MTQASPSPVPVRYPQGVSTDWKWGPLGHLNRPSPANSHLWFDDFDLKNATYTYTVDTNGTIASTAGDGGLMLFTTNSSTPLAGDLASIQLPAAGFVYEAGKRMFFGCRLKVSSAANVSFNVGLIQTTTTPFTVTDGIYLRKATGSAANLTLVSMVGSAATTVAIPTTAYTLADATNIDLAIEVQKNGDVVAWAASQLFGWIPESNPPSGTGRGFVARLTAPTLTTAALNPTLALSSGTASSKTMTVDFAYAAKER